jgi:hypothetical protein
MTLPIADIEALMAALFSITPQIRYGALAGGQDVELRERPGLTDPSGAESDHYEELLVNPTLVALARQRGEIDCGGLRVLVVGYGNFHQLVIPTEWGHASIAFERESDPLDSVDRVAEVLGAHG